VTTSATLFRTRDLSLSERPESLAETQPFKPSITDLWGITVQQQWRLKNYYILSYDYSYTRNRTFETAPDPDFPIPFDLRTNIGRLNATLSRDTRDDILNASRGSFLSNSFEFAPPGLGGSLEFVRNYTQYLHFRPLKQNLVWASAFRAGIARAFGGEDLILSEQFTAGGATTLRAFEQDRLTLDPGNALLIVNQELRFPVWWKLGATTFFDIGNVYRKAGNFDVFDLRYSPGFGLRVQTPLVLLRLDVGLNLWARSGEPPRRFVFGIGQAF
jgi:outer membrane protein insertion porin family